MNRRNKEDGVFERELRACNQDRTRKFEVLEGHDLYTVWLPADRKYIILSDDGKPIYQEAFKDAIRSCPADLRKQFVINTVRHRGKLRIFLTFSSIADVDHFKFFSGLCVFCLREYVPQVQGRWDPSKIYNVFRLDNYCSFLSEKSISDEDLIVLLNKDCLAKCLGHRDVKVIRVFRRPHFIEIELSRHLTDREVKLLRDFELSRKLRKGTVRGKLTWNGLYGNRFYRCPHCMSPDHEPSICPNAQKVFWVFHVNQYMSYKDISWIQKRTHACEVIIGTPASNPKPAFADHVTLAFQNHEAYCDNKFHLKSFYKSFGKRYSKFFESQFINVCSCCGKNINFCKCDTVTVAGSPLSAEALVNPPASPAPPSSFNPWAATDHAARVSAEAEAKEAAANVALEKSEVIMSDVSEVKPKHVPAGKQQDISTQKQADLFFEDCKKKGLRPFKIPKHVLEKTKRSLDAMTSGWSKSGQYEEKILGATDAFGNNMGISYGRDTPFKKAVQWPLAMEELAKEAASLASTSDHKVDINLFIANRYADASKVGGIHSDSEPQCCPKDSVIIAYGPREFSIMNRKNPKDPGFVQKTLILDTGQGLVIPSNLNTGKDKIYHRKGKGLAPGLHFTLVGKTYAASKV